MPPYRPPPLSPSPSDDDADVPDQGMNRSSPAAAIEQNSDEEGTGPDAPEAVALTHVTRATGLGSVRGGVARRNRRPCAVRCRCVRRGAMMTCVSLSFPAGFSVSWLPPPASVCVRWAHAAFVSAYRIRGRARGSPPSRHAIVARSRVSIALAPTIFSSIFIRPVLSPVFLSSLPCFTSSFFAHDHAFTPPSTSVVTAATIHVIPSLRRLPSAAPPPRDSRHTFLSTQPPAHLPQQPSTRLQAVFHAPVCSLLHTSFLRVLLAFVSAELHPTIVIATVASPQPSRITHTPPPVGTRPYTTKIQDSDADIPKAISLTRAKRTALTHEGARALAAAADGSGRGASLGLRTSVTDNLTSPVQSHEIRLFPPPPLSRSRPVHSVRCSSVRVQGCAMETTISFEHSHDAVVMRMLRLSSPRCACGCLFPRARACTSGSFVRFLGNSTHLVDRLAPPEFCARGAEDPHSGTLISARFSAHRPALMIIARRKFSTL
ncbi:hypothetical protein DFH09DRAFT_1300236 [Mycena vulgaris]|nr:hypothetical protein DFH09DRAFT_1300236 [Mycena vulgaris]